MAQKIITPGIRQILVWISEQASLTSRYPLKYVGRLADFFGGHQSVHSHEDTGGALYCDPVDGGDEYRLDDAGVAL